MARPRILLTRRWQPEIEAELARRYDLVVDPDDRPLDAAALADAMRSFDAVCPTVTDRIGADLLATPGRRARILANYGVGFDHIDLAAAKAEGIVVTNTPGVLTEATADIAILLMLMASRRAGEGERLVRAGGWTGWEPRQLVGQSLEGKLLGLVGFGRIAQAVASRARAFGMRIGYFSRSRAAPEIERALDARPFPSLGELAAAADVLSVHTPGGPATRHMIDAALLRRMKPTAIVINTARGSVVDEDALSDALASQRVFAAGLDVYEREPAVTPALAALPNVVLLPHLGSATVETRTAMGRRAGQNLDRFFAGQEPPDRVA